MIHATTILLVDGARTTWADFSAANAEDPETLEAVAELVPGEQIMLGGGAAAEFWIARPESADPAP